VGDTECCNTRRSIGRAQHTSGAGVQVISFRSFEADMEQEFFPPNYPTLAMLTIEGMEYVDAAVDQRRSDRRTDTQIGITQARNVR